MAQCSSYRHEITANSPLFLLLEHLHQSGVTDAELDGGYQQIDYTKPNQPNRLVGVGDCFIEAREVQDFALTRWQRYRTEITAWLGRPLPWDRPTHIERDSLSEGGARSERFLATLDMVTEIIKRDLSDAGLQPWSDDYRIAFARGLFWWIEFPGQEEWRRYGDTQRKVVIDAFHESTGGRFKRLEGFFLKAGGLGNFFVRRFPVEIKPMDFGTSFELTTAAHDLYFSAHRAGLNPDYVEITGLSEDRFVCGEVIASRLGIAIPLSSGRRYVVDPVRHKPDAARELSYLLSLRQALIGDVVTQSLANPQSNQDRLTPTPFDGYFASLLPTNSSGAGKSDQMHPILLALRVWNSELPFSAHPAWPSHGLVDFLQLSSIAKSGDNRRQQAATEYAHSLLQLDPRCFLAHASLAREAILGPLSLDPDVVEMHLKTALESLPSVSAEASAMYYLWGDLSLRRGKGDDAITQFQHALENPKGLPRWKGWAVYLLAGESFRRGDRVAAAALMNQAATFAREDLLEKKLDDAQRWSTWLAQQQSRPWPPEALADPAISQPLARLLVELGRTFLFHRHYAEAETWFRRAAEIPSSPSVKKRVLIFLHECLVQRKDMSGARLVWRDIEGLRE